jgi:two-component system NarL family response regulator
VEDSNAVKEGPQRVLLVDDHDIIRKGLRLLLEDEFQVGVLEAANGPDALVWAKDPSVDLVLLDVRLPERDGLWVLREIRATRPELPVLMLSTYMDEEQVEACLGTGAQGYVLKDASVTQLREAIGTAMSGRGLYLHPAVAHQLVAWRRSNDRYADLLSDREVAVLRCVSEGAKNEEIATTLYVSEKTVKSHLSSIFRKLGVSNRTQAAAKAIQERIVIPGDLAGTPAG